MKRNIQRMKLLHHIIAVETIVNNKRCRGKRSFNITKGTSITKAVESLLGKKDGLIKTLNIKN